MTPTRAALGAAFTVLPALIILVLGALIPALQAPERLAGPSATVVDSLRREVAFRDATLTAARADGFSMSVDPSRNVIELRQGAVVLRRVRPSRLNVSPSVRFAPPDSAVVGHVSRRYGLIPTEPVRQVAAPSDTAEAARMPTDIPVESDPAVVTIECGNGLVVRLTPDDGGAGAVIAGTLYRFADRLAANARSFGGGRVPHEISASAPDADLRAIYRALSDGSPVVVRSGPSAGASSR